jgi:DNA polymerase/3'-5' exonuclease PolX
MKIKFPRATALTAARDVLKVLTPACEPGRIIVAGSLRRRKLEVGDVEIVYVSRMEKRQVDFFKSQDFALATEAIKELETAGILEKRENVLGHTVFGKQNKLMRHVATGVPIDLFATIETSWFNYLVCRTGPAESNTAIAQLARDRGWSWHPYGSGFTKDHGVESHNVTSEQDLFKFLGLPYREPWERGNAKSDGSP